MTEVALFGAGRIGKIHGGNVAHQPNVKLKYVVDPDAAATNPGTSGLEPADLEQLPDPSRFTAVRNLLYAIEWWVFGAFAAFIWWRYVRDVTTAREPEPVPDDDPVPSEP